jgi:hypothetical protein
MDVGGSLDLKLQAGVCLTDQTGKHQNQAVKNRAMRVFHDGSKILEM